MVEKRTVYFDNIVTTPMHGEVLEAMIPFLQSEFGNPLSFHFLGDGPRKALEESREKVAGLINASTEEIIFTSSGTEANNLAIRGTVDAVGSRGRHLITTAVEHFSVLYPLKTMEKKGFEVTYLPVDRQGLVDPDDLKKVLRKETILVSVMMANNEIGTIEPVAEMLKIVKDNSEAYFHTDAVAAAGQIPVDVQELGVDLLSLSAHQLYGPKGAAALFLRPGTRMLPMMEGGIQEGGRRAGTENVAGIVGFGKAAEMAGRDLDGRASRLAGLREGLKGKIAGVVDRVVFTGHPDRRLPGHLSLCVEFIEGEALLMRLNALGVAAASGSTCTSKALKASHVLASLGLDPDIIQGSMVLSLGDQNTQEEVDYFGEIFPGVVETLRAMSPLYTKYKQQKEAEN
jgi:cysteine desulfurase